MTKRKGQERIVYRGLALVQGGVDSPGLKWNLAHLHACRSLRFTHPTATGTSDSAGSAGRGDFDDFHTRISLCFGVSTFCHRTEAAAPQVDGGTRSNDKAPQTGGDPGPDPLTWTPQQVKEFIAKQRQKRASEQQRE